VNASLAEAACVLLCLECLEACSADRLQYAKQSLMFKDGTYMKECISELQHCLSLQPQPQALKAVYVSKLGRPS
jgi:hypothetical protein